MKELLEEANKEIIRLKSIAQKYEKEIKELKKENQELRTLLAKQ